MGLMNLAFGKKDGDKFHEGTSYLYCSFGTAVTFAKSVQKEFKTIGASIHVIEAEEKINYYMSKVKLNGKEDYRTIIIQDEPENARCLLKIIFEMNYSCKATGFYDMFKASFEKHCPKEQRQKEASQTIINQQVSSADELLKFKQLLDAGVISQEEFDAKKKELLGL